MHRENRNARSVLTDEILFGSLLESFVMRKIMAMFFDTQAHFILVCRTYAVASAELRTLRRSLTRNSPKM